MIGSFCWLMVNLRPVVYLDAAIQTNIVSHTASICGGIGNFYASSLAIPLVVPMMCLSVAGRTY